GHFLHRQELGGCLPQGRRQLRHQRRKYSADLLIVDLDRDLHFLSRMLSACPTSRPCPLQLLPCGRCQGGLPNRGLTGRTAPRPLDSKRPSGPQPTPSAGTWMRRSTSTLCWDSSSSSTSLTHSRIVTLS